MVASQAEECQLAHIQAMGRWPSGGKKWVKSGLIDTSVNLCILYVPGCLEDLAGNDSSGLLKMFQTFNEKSTQSSNVPVGWDKKHAKESVSSLRCRWIKKVHV